jgi:hypothetical protein
MKSSWKSRVRSLVSVCVRALAVAEPLTDAATTHTTRDPEIQNEDEVELHLKCGALKREKDLFDEALEKGSQMPCPSCGISGRKGHFLHSKRVLIVWSFLHAWSMHVTVVPRFRARRAPCC